MSLPGDGEMEYSADLAGLQWNSPYYTPYYYNSITADQAIIHYLINMPFKPHSKMPFCEMEHDMIGRPVKWVHIFWNIAYWLISVWDIMVHCSGWYMVQFGYVERMIMLVITQKWLERSKEDDMVEFKKWMEGMKMINNQYRQITSVFVSALFLSCAQLMMSWKNYTAHAHWVFWRQGLKNMRWNVWF